METPPVSDQTRMLFQRVYAWMFLGLLISGATAYVVSGNSSFYELILYNGIIFYGLIIFELVLVLLLVWLFNRISTTLALVMFLLYSFVTGLTLSAIFLVYTLGSIGLVFFISAGMFGVISLYGYITKADLTKMGQILFMGLLGIVIASIVNLFLANSVMDFVISILAVIIFTGLTAYDTQKIKRMAGVGNIDVKKQAIRGALSLYLDFINLFLHLLRLLGKRRR